MFPAGIAAFEKRQEHKSKIYAFETDAMQLPEEFLKNLSQIKSLGNILKTLLHLIKKHQFIG